MLKGNDFAIYSSSWCLAWRLVLEAARLIVTTIRALAGGPSELSAILTTDSFNQTQSLSLKKAKSVLYADCSAEVADWAVSQLQPEPLALFKTPIHWIDSSHTRDKRTYILCEQDKAVHPLTQRHVLKQYPCNHIHLQTGHFPFLSHPEQVARLLTRLNKDFIKHIF